MHWMGAAVRQDEKVQSQGLGQAAVKGQEEMLCSLHLAFSV